MGTNKDVSLSKKVPQERLKEEMKECKTFIEKSPIH